MSEKSITLTQWTDYLNSRTQGFACTVCQHHDWEVQASDGLVDPVHVAIHKASEADVDAMFDDAGKTQKQTPSPLPSQETMADKTITIRCGYCGHLVFFDRAFVEEKIHG